MSFSDYRKNETHFFIQSKPEIKENFCFKHEMPFPYKICRICKQQVCFQCGKDHKDKNANFVNKSRNKKMKQFEDIKQNMKLLTSLKDDFISDYQEKIKIIEKAYNENMKINKELY